MRVRLSLQSNVSTTRAEVRARAKLSLSFFARNLLGVRLSEKRLQELQDSLAPHSPFEEKLLSQWEQVRDGGEAPKRAQWAFPKEAAEAEAEAAGDDGRVGEVGEQAHAA
jgi:hypothetical protein